MDNILDQSQNYLGSSKNEVIDISDSELVKFKSLFTLMVFIVDKQDGHLLYKSDSFETEFNKYGKTKIAKIILKHHDDLKLPQFNLSLVYQGLRTDYTVDMKSIRFHEKEARLGVIQALQRASVSVSTDLKITHIASSFLKIISSVDIAEDISITLHMILSESIKAFDQGHYGSVFIVQEDRFKIISQLGYGDEIHTFTMPITQSFLYTATKGKMDKIMLIEDIQRNYNVITLKDITGEDAMISSSIVAPLFYRGSLYGMMSIDSNNLHAFNQDDLVVMTFIRDNIQSIISNQLNFLERTNQALTDHLTGLYNRHFLAEYFNSILERSKRYKETFSLVVFDIDNLKIVNDRYGHLVGDYVLKAFAKSLQKNSRRSDILARYGGDEFIALFLMTEESELIGKLNAIDRHTSITLGDNQTIKLDYGFSYGIASYPKDADTYTGLIDIADGRMYQAKLLSKQRNKRDGR